MTKPEKELFTHDLNSRFALMAGQIAKGARLSADSEGSEQQDPLQFRKKLGDEAKQAYLLEEPALKAQYELGTCYELGRGVKQDLAKAEDLYRKAAVRGLPEAQHDLGFICGNVHKDYTAAILWFSRAVLNYGRKNTKLDVDEMHGELLKALSEGHINTALNKTEVMEIIEAVRNHDRIKDVQSSFIGDIVRVSSSALSKEDLEEIHGSLKNIIGEEKSVNSESCKIIQAVLSGKSLAVPAKGCARAQVEKIYSGKEAAVDQSL